MLILYFSWDGLRGKRLGFWVYLEVKTVGTAVPGTAMSSVQDVKAEDMTGDFAAQYAERTSAAWMSKVKQVFDTLYVGADQNILTQTQWEAKQYITGVVLGAEIGDPLAVYTAIQENFDAILGEGQWDLFMSDHVLKVDESTPDQVAERVDNQAWNLTFTVYYDETKDTSSAQEKTLKKTLELSANEAYASEHASAGAATISGGNGINEQVSKALDIVTSADIAENLQAVEDELPGIVSISTAENLDAALIADQVIRAYNRALSEGTTYGLDPKFANYFTAFIDVDNMTAANCYIDEEGYWHGNLEIRNTKDSTDITTLQLSFKLTVSSDIYKEMASYLDEHLNGETLYVPFGADLRDGYGNGYVEDSLMQTAKELFEKHQFIDTNGALADQLLHLRGGATVLTKIDDHTAQLEATLVIGMTDSQGGIVGPSEEIPVTMTVSEDVIDNISLQDASGAEVSSQELEIAQEDLSNLNIANAVITGAKLGQYDSLPYELFQNQANEYFTIDNGGFNKNKLGSYEYTVSSNDDRSPDSADKTVTVKVVKTIQDLLGSYTSVSSSDTNVAAIAADGTITAYNAGETTITVKGADFSEKQYKLTVKEDGTFTLKQVVNNADSYVSNSTDVLGFVYHDGESGYSFKTTHKVASATEESDIVADVTFDAEANAFVIKPVAEGTAEVTIKGGDRGRLEATIDITVDKFGVVTTNVATNVTGFKLDTSAEAAVNAANFYENDYVTIDSIGFDENDKLIILYEENGQTKQDTVPATDLKGVYLNTIDNARDMVINFFYAGYVANMTVPVMGQMSIGLTELGLVPTEIVNFEGKILDQNRDKITGQYASVEIVDGQVIIKRTSKDKATDANLVTVADEKGNQASFTITVRDDGTNTYMVEITNYTPYDLTKTATSFTAPTKTSYYIGEKLDTAGGSININNAASIALEPYMVTGFDSSVATQSQLISVSYGMLSRNSQDYTYSVRIKARTETVNLSDLGLEASEIKTVSSAGDDGITAKLDGDKIEIAATKINESGAAIIETKSGDKLAVRVDVDENGQITTDVVKTFEESSKSLDNTEDVFGIIGTTIESENPDVATAVIKNGFVTITSHAEGSTAIKVANGEDVATIDVTVDEFGNITTTVHKYNEDGWRDLGDGNWGYIRNGERVVSDWVVVEEADPYNNNEVGEVWYHFGADGLMQRGWIVDETGWKIYLLDSNGRMMHSQWVNAPAQESLNRPAGMYKLTDDGAVQMNGWAKSVDNENIEWFCNAGNGLFEVDNPASWRVVG